MILKENLDVEKTEGAGMVKKALLVTRVSGFIPQFEMNNENTSGDGV